MNILKQSTAATIKLGPFIDDTDGKTAETGLTISQADIRLSKNGGDIAQSHNSAGATHDELGYYNVPLDATDTGTLGRLRVLVSEAGALPVWQDFLIVTANVFDTLCSTDTFDVNVTSLADDVITAGKFDESTAFPLKSADTGSTQVARVGADGDTLETLSDEIAAVKAETAAILVDTGTDGVKIASAQTVATVTNLTNLPSAPAEWLTASALKADAVTKIQNGLALEATLTAIKGAGWTTETLAAIDVLIDAIKAKTNLIPATPAVADEYDAALAAIQADLDNPDQYKADVSGLATTAHVQEVENKIDAIDVTVNTIPTNPLLDTAYIAPDNASIAAILEDTGTTLPATLAGLATSTEVGAIALLDEVVVGSYTMQDILKILAAKMVGKATGGGTATITYRGVDDTSDVIIETVDSNGNRSAVTLTV